MVHSRVWISISERPSIWYFALLYAPFAAFRPD